MSLVLILAVFVVVALVLVSVSATFQDQRERSLLSASVAEGMTPLLHSINLDRCIGCEGCVDACPTKVLGMQDHKVTVLNFKDCVQCEQCAWACPTTALVMFREGTEPQKLTVPELDPHFQTSVPGQYLIGEVAGKPLVKNAANIGRLVIEHMLSTGLSPSPVSSDGVVDVAIVGSGPGGLSAAFACMKHGISAVVLEKEHTIASTVARYPKGKDFMSEPVESRNLSFLPVFDASKEELLAAWETLIAETKLPIQKGEAVESVKRGEDGIFEIRTTVTSYRARRVVLATGLRGKPRLLAVPGANLPKVHAILEDPDLYAGQHVLVVGGGDSALEAAMSLADAGSITTLSYRSNSFKRAKIANQKRIQEYGTAGKVRILMESDATAFDDESVTIKLAGGESEQLPNQQAFLLIGAEAPVGWLEKLGVCFVQRPHQYALGSSDTLLLELVKGIDDCPADPLQAAARIRGEAIRRHAPLVLPKPRTQKPKRARSVIEAISSEWTRVRTTVGEMVGGFTPAPTFIRAGADPFAATQKQGASPFASTQSLKKHVAPPPRVPQAAAPARMQAAPARMQAAAPARMQAAAPARKQAAAPRVPQAAAPARMQAAPARMQAAALRKRPSSGPPPIPRGPGKQMRPPPPPARRTTTDNDAPLVLGSSDFSDAEVGSAIDNFFAKTDVVPRMPPRLRTAPGDLASGSKDLEFTQTQVSLAIDGFFDEPAPITSPPPPALQRPKNAAPRQAAPLPRPSTFQGEDFDDDHTRVDPSMLSRASYLR